MNLISCDAEARMIRASKSAAPLKDVNAVINVTEERVKRLGTNLKQALGMK